MRWIAVLLALWLAPVSFLNDDTEEPTAVKAVERGGCPGGKCPPKRPRPRPTR
jgi:hypothetical protein